MVISALSCHGNPVHPDAKKAQADHDDYLKTIELANLLGVDTIVTFSGCPGDGPTASHANWVTCPWPPEFSQVLDYQWNEVLIPYWKKAGKIAEDAGVKVAIEMHPGFLSLIHISIGFIAKAGIFELQGTINQCNSLFVLRENKLQYIFGGRVIVDGHK